MSEKPDPARLAETSRIAVRPMQADDYSRVELLWGRAGIPVRTGADDLAAIALFLGQNADLSTVAECEERCVGALLCGEDGRAGFIHRVAVDPECDRVEVVSTMLRRCLLKLRALRLTRCYLLEEDVGRSVEIGRLAANGLGGAVEKLTTAAMQLATRALHRGPGEPALACEVIVPRKVAR